MFDLSVDLKLISTQEEADLPLPSRSVLQLISTQEEADLPLPSRSVLRPVAWGGSMTKCLKLCCSNKASRTSRL